MLKFIKLDDKKRPVENFDTTYISTDSLENAGVKLTTYCVIVDFDAHDEEEQEQLNKVIDYIYNKYPTFKVTTTRGAHLYYRKPDTVNINNWVAQMTVCGVKVDYKTGARSQGVIKLNGKLRKTSYPVHELDLKNLPPLPIELYPLMKGKNNMLMGLKEGDGRNSNLYKHLILLKENNKISADIKQVAHFINNYIFKQPLENNELNNVVESVTNKEAVKGSNGVYYGDEKNMVEFAKFVVSELDIKIYNYIPYFKSGYNYSSDSLELNRSISKFLPLSMSQYKEVEGQLAIYGELIKQKKFKVKIRNGVIVEDTIVNYDCGFTPFFLDVNYDPSAYDKNVDDFLNFAANDKPDLRLILEELIGHVLMVENFPHKLFFLSGTGANGKSTFVKMINEWVGDLASHIDVSAFDDGTSIGTLGGKLVNIADDVDAIYLEKSKNLKTIASGDIIDYRAIYSKVATLKSVATLIFTANELPNIKDKTDGIKRRFIVIPFLNKVTERKYNLDELLSSDQAKSYLLNLGLKGIGRMYKNHGEISNSNTVTNATKQYYIDNNSVLQYLDEYPDIENNSVTTVYEQYSEFCEDSGLKPVSKNKFSRELTQQGYITKVSKILGKPSRIIVKN